MRSVQFYCGPCCSLLTRVQSRPSSSLCSWGVNDVDAAAGIVQVDICSIAPRVVSERNRITVKRLGQGGLRGVLRSACELILLNLIKL